MEVSGKPLIIITGCSGLLGVPLIEALTPEFRVVGIDLRPPRSPHAGFSFIECDLTSDASVEQALRAIADAHGTAVASVIHLAAYYDFAGAPSPLYDELTVQGTRRLLTGLQSFDVEQLIFSSTLLVMKPSAPGGLITESSPLEATWDYPRSKIAAEQVIRDERGDIPAVILRLAGVYDDHGHSPPITNQIQRIHERRLESHFYPADEDRGEPFVHLDDVVSAVRQAIDRRGTLDGFETFLIAEPQIETYGGLQNRIGELLHGKQWRTYRVPRFLARIGAAVIDRISAQPQFIKPWMVDRAGDHFPISIRKANERLGWSPRHRLPETLVPMIQRLRADPVAFYEENELDTSRLSAHGDYDMDVDAPPFARNPSAWSQRVSVALLAVVGTLISAYLALYQWRLIDSVWDPFFGNGSELVLDSHASERMRTWFGVPDAAMGALAYLGDAIFALAGSTRRWQFRPWLVIVFGLDVIPLGIVSIVLVGVQGLVVGQWCTLCLVTAAVSLLLILLAYDEVWASLKYLYRIWRRTHRSGTVWRAVRGKFHPVAAEVALAKGAA